MLSRINNVIIVSVNDLSKKLEQYLSEVTGLKVVVEKIHRIDLPHLFSHLYTLYHLNIGRTSFVAVFLRQEMEFKPAQFLKHIRQASLDEKNEICVIAKNLPAYVRKRLIEKRVSFVVPGMQMYLPTLGMELRKRQVGKKPNSVEHFSPATQVVLLYYLLGRVQEAVTPLELSYPLGYTAMTMSRVLDELEASKIAKVERVGRSRFVTFPEDRDALWLVARDRMRSPIVRTLRVFKRNLPQKDVLPAGLSALSAITMLSEPPFREYAVSNHKWGVMKQAGIEVIPIEEPGTCSLQVWRYDPKILETDGCVDPFSLYLSLQDTNDERIEMALEELMEHYL